MTYDEFKQNFLSELLNIKSFAGRIRYANEQLIRIGGGSGRIVYNIDDEKVLKLAKNTKGIAQNEAEANAGYYRDTQHIVTKIFDNENNYSWLISEKAKKVTEKRIKELTGISSLNDLHFYLKNFISQNKGGSDIFGQKDEIVELLNENEFVQDLLNFVNDYSQETGDMGRPSSYGEVLRDGQPTIVLTDYGLNDEVYNTYYSPQRKQQYKMYELFNYADGNDDILSDTGDSGDIRRGMWAQMPYSVSDGDGVINEEFIDFVSNRDTYPDKLISNLPLLTDHFHECVNNIGGIMKVVENKEQFYNNLLELQNYLISRKFYNRDPLLREAYHINEEIPNVEHDNLNDRNYSDKIAKEVTGKLELSTPKYLGGGGNGFAYEINNNLVMKLTTDVSEADAASKLLRSTPKNIAIIYNLYKILDTETNKTVFAIMQENINDKPLEKFRKINNDINKISPNNLSYEDIMYSIKIPKRFNYNQMIEFAQHILTDNPDAGVSQGDRQIAYEFLIAMFNIRKELLDFGIKSTDYIAIANLGYKNGVLKFFDTGGYYGVTEPNIKDDNVINLPEDGSAKFTTDSAVNQDDFPAYNTNDTSPSINNNLHANIASQMYEDLEYNHVVGDVTQDEYKLSEEYLGKFIENSNRVYSKNGEYEVFKNPKTIKRLKPSIRGIIDNNGNLYVIDDNMHIIHNIFSDWLIKHGVSIASDTYNSLDTTIPVQRYENTNKFYISESIHPDRIDFNKEKILPLLKKAGEKNPTLKFMLISINDAEDTNNPHNEEFIRNLNERNKSFVTGSKTVKVKRKCQLAGLGNTSVACNQGDINNLEFGSVNEDLDYNILNYGVGKDEMISIPDFPLKKLRVSKRGITASIQDIRQGRPSQTDEPVTVFYNIENKQFLVEDGYHRIAQAYLNKETTIPVNIYSDKWSDYVANVSDDNQFKLSEDEETEYQKYDAKSNAAEDRANKMYNKIDKLQAKNDLKYLKSYFTPEEMKLVYNYMSTNHQYFNTGKNPYIGAHALKTRAWKELEINDPEAYKEYSENSSKLFDMFKAVQNFVKKNRFVLDKEFSSDEKFGMGGKMSVNEISHFTTTNNAIQILRDGYFIVSDEGGVAFTTNKDLIKKRKPIFYHPQGDWYEGTTYKNLSTQFVLDFNKIKADNIKYKRGNENIGSHVGEEEIRIYPKDYELQLSSYLKKVIFDPSKEKNNEVSQELINLLKEKNIQYYVKNDVSDINNLKFGSVNETVTLDLPIGDIQGGFASYKIMNDGQVVGEMELMTRGNKYLVLDKIFIEKEFRGLGYANDAMRLLFEYCDNNKKIITLTPDNVWGASKGKLLKWYKSLGFILNKGKNKDFETMQLMYKLPKGLVIQEYFSSLVPTNEQPITKQEFAKYGNIGEDIITKQEFAKYGNIGEDIMSIQDLPFKDEIEQLGGKIYSVGGAVRDEFLGKDSKDLDILITGIPMDKLEQLLSKYGRVDAVGKSFGVLKFKLNGSKEEIDITIPRTEKPTGTGGHKGFDVTSDHTLPIEKDLERRDFTINAIGKDNEGNIVDPYHGQEDLKNKIIRVVNPDAFSDDPLRMIRAIQFASRFGFTIEPKTADMIRKNAARIKEISPERILIEFDKIVKKGNKFQGAFLLKNLGLTPQIFGNDAELYVSNDWENVETMSEFIWLLSNHLVDNVAEFYKTNLKGDIETYKELKALQYAYNSVNETDIVKARTAAHNVYVTANNMLESKILPDTLKNAANDLLSGKYPKSLGELTVNGNDLMNLGLQGKEIGDMLKKMLLKIYGDEVRNTKEDLLSLIKQNKDSVEEGYFKYSEIPPSTWNVNGKNVSIDFFVREYDKWNNQGDEAGYSDVSHVSVFEFLQNNYEDFSVDNKLKKELYWKLIDRELLNEREEQIEYGVLMLFIDIPMWKKITSIIKKDDIYKKDDEFGIETEPHVSILYGFHNNVDADKVFDLYKENFDLKPIEISVEGISTFENEEFDVVKIDVSSKILTKMNSVMRKLPNTTTFPKYDAHITLAYVKKGRGKDYVKSFKKNNTLVGNELVFSTKEEKHSNLKLNEKGILKENVKKVNYSAVVLDDQSRTKLLKVFNSMIPEDWEVIAHHLTIKMGALKDGSQEKQDMIDNKVINLSVIDYAIDDKVMAVGVDGYHSAKTKPHITIAINRDVGGKPFMSNNLTDWRPLGFPLELTGKINEIRRNALNESTKKSKYIKAKDSLMKSKSIDKEMKELILKYMLGGSTYHEGGYVHGLSKPQKLCDKSKKIDGVSMGADKNGFYVYTHRAKSKSHPTPEQITVKEIKFIESTG